MTKSCPLVAISKGGMINSCWGDSCQFWNESMSDCGLKTNPQVAIFLSRIEQELSNLNRYLRDISYALESKLR